MINSISPSKWSNFKEEFGRVSSLAANAIELLSEGDDL